MRHSLRIAGIIFLSILLLSSCGKGRGLQLEQSDPQTAGRVVSSQEITVAAQDGLRLIDTRPDLHPSGVFTIEVEEILPVESNIGLSRATIVLTPTGPVSELYLDLVYDRARYTFVSAEPEEETALPEDYLFVSGCLGSGRISTGLARIRAANITGSLKGRVINFILENVRENDTEKRILKPPTGSGNSVSDLSYVRNPDQTVTLRWTERNQGDYNLDGQVKADDLSRVAFYFGSNSSDPDPLIRDLAKFVGGADEVISATDVSPIAFNFGAELTGYAVLRVPFGSTLPELRPAQDPNVTGPYTVKRYNSPPNSAQWQQFEFTELSPLPTTAPSFDYFVRAYSDAGDNDQAPNSNTVTISTNSPPVAVGKADTTSGAIGTTVNFDASLSYDPDGSITLYEWDFEGDGTWDYSNGSTGNTSHQYTFAAVYDATLRVTDSAGSKSLAFIKITIVSSGNVPPVAQLAGPSTVLANQTVNLDASGSFDPDGFLTTYRFDFLGDGSFVDQQTPVGSTSYSTPGIYTAKVQVVDNGGANAEATLTINVIDPQSQTKYIYVATDKNVYKLNEEIKVTINVANVVDLKSLKIRLRFSNPALISQAPIGNIVLVPGVLFESLSSQTLSYAGTDFVADVTSSKPFVTGSGEAYTITLAFTTVAYGFLAITFDPAETYYTDTNSQQVFFPEPAGVQIRIGILPEITSVVAAPEILNHPVEAFLAQSGINTILGRDAQTLVGMPVGYSSLLKAEFPQLEQDILGSTVTIIGKRFGLAQPTSFVEMNGTRVPDTFIVSWTSTQIQFLPPSPFTSAKSLNGDLNIVVDGEPSGAVKFLASPLVDLTNVSVSFPDGSNTQVDMPGYDYDVVIGIGGLNQPVVRVLMIQLDSQGQVVGIPMFMSPALDTIVTPQLLSVTFPDIAARTETVLFNIFTQVESGPTPFATFPGLAFVVIAPGDLLRRP